MMKPHLFFTGEKRVGKSTLIQTLLNRYPCHIGGFRTVRTNALYGNRYAIHLLKPFAVTPTEENLLFLCDGSRDQTVWDRFDQLGCAALEDTAGCDLILMDELGPNEVHSKKFQSAVLTALDGDIPILGVLQKADSPFLDQIAKHPKVRVVEVTRENRDFLSNMTLF